MPAFSTWIVFCLILVGPVFPQRGPTDARDQRVLQVQQLIAQGDLDGARKLLKESTKQYPADPGFDNLLGIIEAQQGNYEAAEGCFNRAISRAQRFTGAYLNLGRLYQEHSAVDRQALRKAASVYHTVLQYDPENVEANYQSATLLMRQGAYQASLDRLSRLPAEIQNRSQTLSVRCANFAGLGNRERADETASQLLSHPEFSELDALTILSTVTASGRDDLNVRLLEGLLKRQPLSPEMMRSLGLTYERTGRLVEARQSLESSVAGARPSVTLLLELARVAHKQQDYKGALGYLAHARDLEPNNASSHFYFGLVCMDLNLVAEAHNSFGKAVSLEPKNPSYNYAMGAASVFRHNPAEAIPYFEKYIHLKPLDPRGNLGLGVAMFKAKQYDAAARVLAGSVKHSETAATAHYYLGTIARQKAQVNEAIGELKQALKSKPDYPDALAELGRCQLMRKDYELAGQYLRRALEINPNHYAANFNLLTLYARTSDERQAAQAKRFEEIQKLSEEKTQDLLRIVEVHPYPAP